MPAVLAVLFRDILAGVRPLRLPAATGRPRRVSCSQLRGTLPRAVARFGMGKFVSGLRLATGKGADAVPILDFPERDFRRLGSIHVFFRHHLSD